MAMLLVLAATAGPLRAETTTAVPATPHTTGHNPTSSMTMETFLDRLMMAESGGRDNARNLRSTAVGPFQFIESTFLAVARSYFAAETEKLSRQEILALRTNRAFARRAAEAYTKENAGHLTASGQAASYPNLRLAFLLGAGGAIRILQASPKAALTSLLSPTVIRANPFMRRLSAEQLIARSARDLEISIDDNGRVAGITPQKPVKPAIRVRCNLELASCKRWLALAQRRIASRRVADRRR